MELSYAKVKAIQDELYAVAGEPGVLPMPRVTLTVDTETLNPIQKLILEGLATPQQTPKPPLSDGAREAVDEHPRTREDF